MHNIATYVLVTARDRARLTSAVQEHLVASWATWINRTRGLGVDRDLVRETISVTKDDQRDNETDELPPDVCELYDTEEDYDPFEDSEDFAPINNYYTSFYHNQF